MSLLLLLSLSARGQAVIEGSVKLPPAKPVVVANARYQPKTAAVPAPPEPPVAVVYLEGNFSSATNSHASSPVRLEQKNLQFSPGILAIQKGTKVEFPNLDDEYHNVLSYSKAKELDLGRYRKNEAPPVVLFDKPGAVDLSCEIHAHMSGTILVLDTPYFTTSDASGKFRLERLPAGKYKLKAWLNRKTVWELPIELKDGETVPVNFAPP